MSNFFYKQKIDAVYLNYEDKLDENYVLNIKNYDLLGAYPKTKLVLEALDIEKRLFYLTKTKSSKKMYINTENAFLKFQNSLKANRKDNEKQLSAQLKGHYFLTKTFNDFKEFYLKSNPDSISKIEVSIDFEASSVFLKETAKLFLNKNNYTNWEGSKTYINLEDDEITGISYLNSSKVIKVYNKKLELNTNSKKALFYEKNPEFTQSENLYRVEIGYITSKRIKALFDIDNLIKNKNVDEASLINQIKKKFFSEFKVSKKSELKSILQIIKF